MRPWLKLLLKITGGILLFIILLYAGIAWYINKHKPEILRSVTGKINEHINGKVIIEDMEPSLIKGLPGVSLALNNVQIIDTQFTMHKKELLRAKAIYVSIDVLSILTGKPQIRNIDITSATVCLYTDSSGYSNTSVFRVNTDTTRDKKDILLNHLTFHNVAFVLENQSKAKLFRFEIARLALDMNYTPTGWNAHTAFIAQVKNMSFNTVKGSYLKGSRLEADLDLNYDKEKSLLVVPDQDIQVNYNNIGIGGRFSFAQKPAAFELNIKADNIIYREATALLTKTISKKLDVVDFQKPVSALANIKGHLLYRDTPLVQVSWQVKDNTFITPAGEVKGSFTGSYMNELVPGMGHGDFNSMIILNRLDGSWQGIPITADSVRIANLTNPVLVGGFTSNIPLVNLNSVIGGNIFRFDGGTAKLDLHYKGGVNDDDTTTPYVYGTIKMQKGAMTYLPRDLSFTDVAATIRFNGADLLLEDIKVRKGSNILKMEGSIRNFLNLYYYAPEKIALDWRIKSDVIDLNEFKSFLSQRKRQVSQPRKATYARINKLSNQLDLALEESNVHMQVQVNKVMYKNFTADDINAAIDLTQEGITLEQVKLKHAGGNLEVKGKLIQHDNMNNVAITAAVNHVNVKSFFHAFDNFGQESLTDKNIGGKLSARVNITGKLMNTGQLVPKSMSGIASFELKDGVLEGFEPLIDIGKIIFRKRHMERITFSTIKNKFDINGDRITIYPMHIESSAINMSVAGVYALSKGTDIRIDVNLRNPKRNEPADDDVQENIPARTGMQVHLMATDGADGKVKIKWKLNNKKAGKIPEQHTTNTEQKK